MKAIFCPSFWTHPDLEDQPPEVKLTLCWIKTNHETAFNMTGMFTLSSGRFAYETGLDASWLTKTLDALPHWFVVAGKKCLFKNFIAEQFGTGKNLASSTCSKALRKRIPDLPHEFQEAIYALHPELKPSSPSVSPPGSVTTAVAQFYR